MKNYELERSLIIEELHKRVKRFIEGSQTLNKKTKDELIKELPNHYAMDAEIWDNWDDKIVHKALEYSVKEWARQNLELLDLWKKVAIENAGINNEPYLVANLTIQEAQKAFNIES